MEKNPMRSFLASASLALCVMLASNSHANDVRQVAIKRAPKYSTANTSIGTLLDNAVTRAIVEKNIPGMTTDPRTTLARGMTLRAIQRFSPDQLTNARLAAIDAALSKIPG